MWRWRFFLQLLKYGGQNKMILSNFGNLALKLRLLIKWGLGVGVVGKLIFRAEFKIQRTLLYLVIWSTFQKVI